ncbi:MAG: Signal transduction histidine kinase [Mycetocola sp.]|jgi:signal transduction histidine kinase|nr:Signal transduction histidine kinase [Mycetocola sp.]
MFEVGEYNNPTGTSTVNSQLEGEPVALPMSVDATLLRIAQGAVANVVRHA